VWRRGGLPPSGARSVADAFECIGGRIDATAGERGWRIGAAVEEVGEQVDGIGDVERAVVVAIAGIIAGRILSPLKEMGQQIDAVGDVDTGIVVAIAANRQQRPTVEVDAAGVDGPVIVSERPHRQQSAGDRDGAAELVFCLWLRVWDVAWNGAEVDCVGEFPHALRVALVDEDAAGIIEPPGIV